MRLVVLGAHLTRDDVEPLATALPVGELFLSGVDVPDEQSLGDRDLLLRAARIRSGLLEKALFVAIRYGVTVSSTDEALGKCGAHLGRWKALLEEHRDEVEMTLKVAAASPRPRPDRRDFATGAAYLTALHSATRSVSAAEGFQAAVEALFDPLVTARRWLHRDGASLELAALIRRSDVEALAACGEELKTRFPAVPFLLSGPWPLEVFADADQQ